MSIPKMIFIYIITRSLVCAGVAGTLMWMMMIFSGYSFGWGDFYQYTLALWLMTILFDLYDYSKIERIMR